MNGTMLKLPHSASDILRSGLYPESSMYPHCRADPAMGVFLVFGQSPGRTRAYLNSFFVSETTTPESARSAMMFGIAIRPLRVSEIR